jgi:aspartokinase
MLDRMESGRGSVDLMQDKIAINGLKISEALIPMWVRRSPGSHDPVARLCRMLADIQVNLAYMTTSGIGAPQPAMCCIDPEDHAKVEAWLVQDAQLSVLVKFGDPVGLLSLFPHQANLKLLGTALTSLNDSGVTIHGLASSISALTFIVDFVDLEKAATILQSCMALPQGHQPLRPEFKVRQEGISR